MTLRPREGGGLGHTCDRLTPADKESAGAAHTLRLGVVRIFSFAEPVIILAEPVIILAEPVIILRYSDSHGSPLAQEQQRPASTRNPV